MDLDRNQWYVRWFFWSLDVWGEFTENSCSEWEYRDGTDLCHFMRVTLLWCPLAILMNVLAWVATISVVTVLPMYLFGATGFAWIIGTVCFVIALVVGTKYGARAWKLRPQPIKPIDHWKKSKALVPYAHVIRAYVEALDKKICPLITFTRTEEAP